MPLERIGVVVVHGIGEQKRFEHVDGQVRAIVAALQSRRDATVTVEIKTAGASTFQSQHDTWSTGASVRVLIDDRLTSKRVEMNFHEVWWADVNEPFSFLKQLRFWAWGLAIWLYPGKAGSTLPGANSVRVPSRPNQTIRGTRLETAWARVLLFAVAVVAVAGAASIGMFTFLAQRVLNLDPPKFIRIFVNYLAGVKLYNQKHRRGAGFFPARYQDFLDTINEPPRVSIRRRMIRSIMDAAEERYDRWYVVAHSLGSVVAFNGLMEAASSWPGYFTEEKWSSLRQTLVGPSRPGWAVPSGAILSSPRRPVWAEPSELAYRSHIFSRFHGLLTFGSPLEKFANIWPARVPISREPAFRLGTKWLNIYDPLDPISGVLRSFGGGIAACCPPPENIGYSNGPILLLTHLQYLRPRKLGLSDGIAEWFVTGNSHLISASAGPGWYSPDSRHDSTRWAAAWVSWFGAFLLLLVLGALVSPITVALLVALYHEIVALAVRVFTN